MFHETVVSRCTCVSHGKIIGEMEVWSPWENKECGNDGRNPVSVPECWAVGRTLSWDVRDFIQVSQ